MVVIEYLSKKYDVQIKDISDFLILRKMCKEHGGKNLNNKHFVFTQDNEKVLKYIQDHLSPKTPPVKKVSSPQMDFMNSLSAPVIDDELAAFETPEMKMEDKRIATKSAQIIKVDHRERHIIHKKETPEKKKKISDEYYKISLHDAVQIFMDDLYKIMEKHSRILIDVTDSNIKMKDFTQETYNDFFGYVVKGMVDSGFINPDIASILPVEYTYGKEIVDKIKSTIKFHTYTGGIGKSKLRKRIGRNHKNYVTMVDEILDYLVFTKQIILDKTRYLSPIQSHIGFSKTSQPRAYVTVGRPKKKNEVKDIRVKSTFR